MFSAFILPLLICTPKRGSVQKTKHFKKYTMKKLIAGALMLTGIVASAQQPAQKPAETKSTTKQTTPTTTQPQPAGTTTATEKSNTTSTTVAPSSTTSTPSAPKQEAVKKEETAPATPANPAKKS
jgi:hypothetical protein